MTKIEAIGWSFYIEHITNPITLLKKDAEQKDKSTIMPKKMKSLSLSRARWALS
jgi:hypothetical protein